MAHRIMVTLDGSETSEWALQPAHDIAKHVGATLILLRACQPPVTPLSAQKYLAEKRKLLDDEGVNLEVTSGDPAEVILKASEGCHLLVMGSHGRKGRERLLFGSVAETVMRKSTCPVCVIRRPTDRLENLRRVMVPLDGSDLARWAVHEASRFCLATGATLILCQVDSSTSKHKDKHADTKKYLREVAASLDAALKVELVKDTGPAAKTVSELASREQVDLIVMASHGRTGLFRWLTGSVSEQILRESSVPLLIVPNSSLPG